MISKQLFCKVLKISFDLDDNLDISLSPNNKEIIELSVPNGFNYSILLEINIYELSFKLKDFLQKQVSFNIGFRNDWFDKLEPKVYVDLYDNRKTFFGDTELEALIKACQWSLDN
jgi:hypothetical protein